MFFSCKVKTMLNYSSRNHCMDTAGGRSSLVVSCVELGIGSMVARTLCGSCHSHRPKILLLSLADLAWLLPFHSYFSILARATVCSYALKASCCQQYPDAHCTLMSLFAVHLLSHLCCGVAYFWSINFRSVQAWLTKPVKFYAIQ